MAQNGDAEICIAPSTPGDMEHMYLDNQTIFVQNSAYVASDPAILVESKWQGFVKGFFSGENLFLIRCTGPGDLWFNTFGGVKNSGVGREGGLEAMKFFTEPKNVCIKYS